MSIGFDPSEVPDSDYDGESLMPIGWYDAVIEQAQPKKTSTGGDATNIWWRIEGPTHANKVVFDWINLHLPSSERATEIGRQTMKRLCNAARNGRGFKDLSELVGNRCKIKVGVQPGKDGYEDKNVVKDYKAHSADGPAMTATPAPAPATFGDDDVPF